MCRRAVGLLIHVALLASLAVNLQFGEHSVQGSTYTARDGEDEPFRLRC